MSMELDDPRAKSLHSVTKTGRDLLTVLLGTISSVDVPAARR